MATKTKIGLGIITAVIIFIVISVYRNAAKQEEYTSIRVSRGTLEQTVDATGKVESAEKIDLNFRITGRIAEILMESGDAVKSGQVLARLDASTLESEMSDARARYFESEADYQKLLAGASKADIKVAEDTVAQKEQDLAAAKNNLESLVLLQETELGNYRDTAIITMSNEVAVAQGVVEEVDNTLTDPDAQSTLSISNPGLLRKTQDDTNLARLAIATSRTEASGITGDFSDAKVLSIMDNLRSALTLSAKALADTLDVLAATLTSATLSETELDTLKSNIKTQQSKINTSQTNAQTAKSNWTNRVAYYTDKVMTYEDAVRSAETALQVAKSQLALKKSPPRQFEIDAARAKVSQAQAALNAALAHLEDAIIRAPIAGTITKKNHRVGEQTSLAEPVLEMIGDSKLQIEVDIPESDISKILVGQTAEITLDAFGADQIFAGRVTFVDPAETLISEVVYYKVKIQFDKADENIKSGMTANISIVTALRKDALWVPARAVKSANGEKYVNVVQNGTIFQKNVITGLRANEGIEILEGLSEGEEVITFMNNGK